MSTPCTTSTTAVLDQEGPLNEDASAHFGKPESSAAPGPAEDTLAVLEWRQEPPLRFDGADLNLRRYVRARPTES